MGRRDNPLHNGAKAKKRLTQFAFILGIWHCTHDLHVHNLAEELVAKQDGDDILRVQRDIAIAIGSSTELSSALEKTLALCMEIDGIEAGGVYLLEVGTGCLRLLSHRNLSSEFVNEVSFFEADSPQAKMVGLGKPIYRQHIDIAPSIDPVRQREGLRVLAVIPIMHEGRALAFLNLASRQLDDFPAGTRNAIETIAAQIGAMLARIEAEESLRQSEARFRELAELLPGIVFETDAQGVFTFVNSRGFEFSGYGPADLAAGFSVLRLIAAEDQQRAIKNIQAVLAGEDLIVNEYQAVRKDGSTFPIVIRSAVIVHDGKPVGLRGLIHDITKRKQLEQQLAAAAKMDAVGQLAGGIAHDYNNLMTSILGYANLLVRRMPAGSANHRAAATIEQAAERATDLTRQLLGFARRGKNRIEPVDLHQIIADVVELLSHSIDQSITMTTELRAHSANVLGDPNQLHQILMNLAINACDAMPDGGAIAIGTANIDIEEASGDAVPLAAGEYIGVTVTDNGVGIPAAQQQQIFEPFFTTKNPGIGTGLGLAMVYGIVGNHDGRVQVKSELGHGFAITIQLPICPDTVSFPLADSKTLLATGSGTILIVDDEPMVRYVLQEMLEAIGYQVLVAGSGSEALDIYRTDGKEVDLVIIDLMMPNMDGRACFAALKELDSQVRALLSTGFSLDGSVQSALDAGMHGFIQKPYEIKKLADVISKAIHGQI